MPKENLSTDFLELSNAITQLENTIKEKQETLNNIAEKMHSKVPVANVDLIINDGDTLFTITLDDDGNFKARPVYEFNTCKI
jgi:hypothetical protein